MSKLVDLSVDDLLKMGKGEMTKQGGPSRTELAAVVMNLARVVSNHESASSSIASSDIADKLDMILKGQTEMSSQLKQVHDDLAQMKFEVSTLRDDMTVVQNRNDRFNDRITELEDEFTRTRDRAERTEQYLRRDQIKVYGMAVQYKKAEDGSILKDKDDAPIPESTETEVLALLKDMDVTCEAKDISIAHRLPLTRTSSVPPVIVKFIRRAMRKEVFEKKKVLKEKDNRKNIFVTDALTPLRAKLLRKLKEANDVKAVYSVEGKLKVVVEERGRERKITIDNLSDVKNLGWSTERLNSLGVYEEPVHDY